VKIILSKGVLFLFCSTFCLLFCSLFCPSLGAQTPNATGGGLPGRQQDPATSKADAAHHIDAEKEANIRRLVELSGVKSNMAASVAAMSTMIRASLEKSGMNNEKARAFSDLVLAKMQEKMASRFDSLLEMLMPVYDKYYTNEDLEGLIAFYGSPLGQKLLKSMPDVLRESQTVGYQWGAKIGEESEREVLAEHPELKPPTPVITNQWPRKLT
jgi:hypothetical protein